MHVSSIRKLTFYGMHGSWFHVSIEGSEIPNTRKGMIITRSIARKVTLTQSPCNSACVAEIYDAPDQKSQLADDFDSIFKSKEIVNSASKKVDK